jgi:hypothetical protein
MVPVQGVGWNGARGDEMAPFGVWMGGRREALCGGAMSFIGKSRTFCYGYRGHRAEIDSSSMGGPCSIME